MTGQQHQYCQHTVTVYDAHCPGPKCFADIRHCTFQFIVFIIMIFLNFVFYLALPITIYSNYGDSICNTFSNISLYLS